MKPKRKKLKFIFQSRDKSVTMTVSIDRNNLSSLINSLQIIESTPTVDYVTLVAEPPDEA